jgi:hypothetical protein
MILPGTYQNGFAPRDGEPLFPELWRGCVGAWNPGLGPSGLTLRDWSPYRNHGTLTNMPAADAWRVNQGQYALSFDGANDSITTAGLGVNAANRSVSCWFRTVRSLANGNYQNIIGWGNAATGAAIYVAVGNDATFGTNAFGVTQFGDSTGFGPVNNGEWRHGVIVNVGTLWSVYVDGIFRTSKTMTTSPAVGSTVRIGSWPFSTGLSTNANFDGQLSDISIYNRAISPNEIRLLASRRGIAYEMAPRNWSAQQIAAYRAKYYSQLVGGGIV